MIDSVRVLPHIPFEKRTVSTCKPFTFGRDWGLYLLLPEREAEHWCPRARNIRISKKTICRSGEAFLRHLLQVHASDRSARYVKILTDRIVRMHAYPTAYGGFSDVWSCLLRSKQKKPPQRVAVKAIRSVIASEKERQVKQRAVEQELSVWAGLKHPNVLPLYGITTGFGPFIAFVCPWAHHGTLSEYLEKFEARLNLKKRLTLLSDIAAGLRYLHSRNIVHGDLSGLNVLITKRGRACLSDFGLSTLVEVSDATSSDMSFPGNIRWAAPELLDGCKEGTLPSQLSTPQADIYSFGSIILQILSGKLPFHETQRVAQIVIMISRGCQPTRVPRWDGEAIPDILWGFVEECWAWPPPKRPSSEDIVHFIKCQLSGL